MAPGGVCPFHYHETWLKETSDDSAKSATDKGRSFLQDLMERNEEEAFISTGRLQELGSGTELTPFPWTEDQIDQADGDSNRYRSG